MQLVSLLLLAIVAIANILFKKNRVITARVNRLFSAESVNDLQHVFIWNSSSFNERRKQELELVKKYLGEEQLEELIVNGEIDGQNLSFYVDRILKKEAEGNAVRRVVYMLRHLLVLVRIKLKLNLIKYIKKFNRFIIKIKMGGSQDGEPNNTCK